MAQDIYAMAILILGEDTKVGAHIQSLLQKSGFKNLVVMDNGIDGMRYLQEKPVDFVICDNGLKQLSGWMFIKEMKTNEKVRNIPSILFGRGKEPAPKEQLTQYGLLEYLTLPVTAPKLEFLINSTISLFRASGTIEHKYTKAKEAQIKAENVQAIEIYQELRGATNKNSRSSLGLAQSYTADNQPEKAEAIIVELAQAGDESPASLFLALSLELRRGNTANAKVVADKIMTITPDIPFNYSRCVKVFIENSCFAEAEPFCRAAIQKGFKLPEFSVGLAKCLYSAEKLEEALKVLDEAAEAFGFGEDMLNLKGVILKRKQDFTGAIKCYEQALKISPMDAKVYFNMANCYIAMKDYPQATTFLETCLKITPDFARGREKLEELKRRTAA
jgi:tetratricopeptide (TPR) repeat protein